MIELSDSEEDSKEIENFLEKVVRENKEDKVNINKGDTFISRNDAEVKEEEEYGETCKETKYEVKEENEHSEAGFVNEVKNSTSKVYHTETNDSDTVNLTGGDLEDIEIKLKTG